MENRNYYVYILTNVTNRVMYIGVTNDLKRRITEHQLGLFRGFTKQYHVHRLVYYEHFNDIRQAIAREKQLKGWSRAKKDALIEERNPEWREIGI